MKTGKEPFNCGIRMAECGMGNPQITPIAQISFPSSASSAKSADKTPIHLHLISVIAQHRACAPRPVAPAAFGMR
jgi:hypothetical protein